MAHTVDGGRFENAGPAWHGGPPALKGLETATMDTERHNGIGVGDFAWNVESEWLGKVVAWETDGNGDRMAKMVGVDVTAFLIEGLSAEDSLTPDDTQWHAPADLRLAARARKAEPAEVERFTVAWDGGE
jgi:hypothetical protein